MKEPGRGNICSGFSPFVQKVTFRNEDIVTWITDHAVPLKSLDNFSGFGDLDKFGEMVNDSRIVALGEATHGTGEFFTLRHRLIRYLVKEKGFNLLGVECSWPQAEHINKYILTGKGNPRQLLSNLHFWWTNTEEMLDIIKWMREYNRKVESSSKIRFYGLDFQYHYGAIDNLLEYLKRVDKAAVEKIESLLAPYIMFSGSQVV
jgi:erythromycin esterase